MMDLDLNVIGISRADQHLIDSFQLFKYSQLELIQTCNDSGAMIGTFIIRDVPLDTTVSLLAKDFGGRPTYSHSDLTSYFTDLLKSYQMKSLQTTHNMCNYLYKHTT